MIPCHQKAAKFIVNNFLCLASEETLHLVLIKIFTYESFIQTRMNRFLQEKDPRIFGNLFPFFVFLQHALFMNYSSTKILNDVSLKKPKTEKISLRDLFEKNTEIVLYRKITGLDEENFFKLQTEMQNSVDKFYTFNDFLSA